MRQVIIDILKTPVIWGAALALIGVIIGQLSTYFTGRWADVRRWHREDATRFLEQRRVAYAAFLSEVVKAAHLVPAATNGPALQPAWSALAALEVIGSPTTISAAQSLLNHTETSVQLNPKTTFDAVWAQKRADCLKAMQDDLKPAS